MANVLLHGSPARIEGPILPSAGQTNEDSGAQPVVYATPSAGWALIFATAQERITPNADNSMLHDNGATITIYVAEDSMELADSGYIYELEEADFRVETKAELVSSEPVDYVWRYLVPSAPFVSRDDPSRLVVDTKRVTAFLERLFATRRTMQALYEGLGLSDRFAEAFAAHESIPIVGSMATDILHGYFHALRTSLLAQLIYLLEEPSAAGAPPELALGAALHDVGRFSEKGTPHGEAGARWVHAHASLAGDVDVAAVASLVEQHCLPEDDPDQPLELSALKDADAVDRLRFLVESQRPRREYLRLPVTGSVLDALGPMAEELYAPEYRLQRALFAAQTSGRSSDGRLLLERPGRTMAVEAALKQLFQQGAAELTGCDRADAVACLHRIAPDDDGAQKVLAVPIVGNSPAELRILANPWSMPASRLPEGTLDELRAILGWTQGTRSHSANIVWGQALAAGAEGLSCLGTDQASHWPMASPEAEAFFANVPAGEALLEGARRVEDKVCLGWKVSGLRAHPGSPATPACLALCPEDGSGQDVSAPARVLDGLAADGARCAVEEMATLLESLGMASELVLGLTAEGEPCGQAGIVTRWTITADKDKISALLGELRERGLADERVERCPGMSFRRAISAVDSQNVNYEVSLSSVPCGLELLWDADGAIVSTVYLQEIIAGIY